ncbi:alpha-D-ribose 1-methylphosphonate 5-triphosphate diphosphatase [Rhizobium sp. C4]|uniref:alpha-D-ribose 1-methylphosphonate 5-triphosphate diphosphatase n=1 Tax=Rhizobium sp. C4 TaxID=1349800 RepID=UPI001E5D3C69|nr:alpha-D-ribose 1-methylphosphonate 5-triphosphate diphosphatase [Rhizobium sp. C4]MCD2171886.1 alpha-D-ribose 1-methylphosphonate 5-triphosphate diphosphatase [Rhizobium sp. C4]
MEKNAATVIEGATLVIDGRLERASLRFEAGRITAIDGARDGAMVIDGHGLLVGPAFIDIHGDAFERQIMPRPGTMFPVDAALLETDRQLAANGIATTYHALTLSWEPGLRSVEMGRAIFDALTRLQPRLLVENRLQLRWESFCFEAVDLIRDALQGQFTPAIAFNDHTSMALLDPSVTMQERPFEFSPDFPVVDLKDPAFAAKMGERAKRAKMSLDDMIALIASIWERRPQVPGVIDTVASLGRAAGAPMLSHDDSQTETRDYFRGQGARISEFPMNRRVARAAREAGDAIVFGAPNAARGGSHLGSSPVVAEMLREGLCDVLASDYYYPAMLIGLARLAADGVGTVPGLWPLVSGNPARALGLDDRGSIELGKRADLVAIEWPEQGTPVVRRTWVAGRTAYDTTPAG